MLFRSELSLKPNFVDRLSVSLVPMRKCLVVFVVIVTKFSFIFVGICSNHPKDLLSHGLIRDHMASVLYSPANWCKSPNAQ